VSKNKSNNTTIVFKVSDNIKDRMIKYYANRKCEKTPPYAIFQVKDFDCVITLYESGKAMFQGLGADIESSIWKEQERVLNNNLINTPSQEKKKKDSLPSFYNESTIGSDEVGTGDYFGPLVVTASFVSKDNISFMQELGVKDSKKLTDDKIIKIAPLLIKRIPYTSIILNNKDYNKYHSSGINMNKVKAILHNKCLLSVIKKGPHYTRIVIDQFEPESAFYNHIKEMKEQVTNITFVTKGEDKCLSVAASSIISRYIFLSEMHKLNTKLNTTLPFGASNLVDEVGQKLVKEYGPDILNEIAKLNFKNTERILKVLK